jgi:hypothetical protein
MCGPFGPGDKASPVQRVRAPAHARAAQLPRCSVFRDDPVEHRTTSTLRSRRHQAAVCSAASGGAKSVPNVCRAVGRRAGRL